jgi:hypothetical protein
LEGKNYEENIPTKEKKTTKKSRLYEENEHKSRENGVKKKTAKNAQADQCLIRSE